MTEAGPEPCSLRGAQRLAATIRAYWAARGAFVEPEVVSVGADRSNRPLYAVRLPPMPRGLPEGVRHLPPPRAGR